ncbi:glycoside hydrolase family 3 C-terminal domain-containing protein [Larsenimonas rhizosphaerae]|uniref:glycoside hydrolase family 3 C-terminal domain-containing protein n=1 Tax=Larsenimonas rhizosphaerae TaxID=2944682 RepID=UPI002033F160|nr:glycoside hydrolase family 3 C-terminal domain-containing protein [Larsenimonas rhizosphaerae]MCM2129359.1 glycoside hydrolase family 3 C-terminal domain-containing protein [Larsenimonas rhizosphaerae]
MRDLDELLTQLTLEEKAGLCSGQDFWHTRAIERLGIPAIMMADGPHGLRKQPDGPGADHVGLLDSTPATCFPTAAGLASSWDTELLTRVGQALGREAQAEALSVVLGPGANIKRSPLCGRNFEYFSEDPLLSSRLASAHIQGVQSQGVGSSLKHFAANNQEHRRMSVDARIDERPLREIYLASFEEAVREGKPWTVMCAYNRLNGPLCSEHHRLLTDILRDEWGFEGVVVSDWAAVNDRIDGLKAGLELEMPSSGDTRTRLIVDAVKEGHLEEAVLDRAVRRLLTLIFKGVDQHRPNVTADLQTHHQLAREAGRQSMVLLKNEQILPLGSQQKVAVIGEFAQRPRFQGGGSSHVNPTRVDTPLDAMTSRAEAPLTYAQGFEIDSDQTNDRLTEEAVAAAQSAEVAVLFVGLPERYESEGYDRTHLNLPANQLALIDAITQAQPATVIVLANGSPIVMPWVDRVPAILEGYLGGQAAGAAISDLLFGDASPAGRLAETFPHRLEDTPCYLSFPGEGDVVNYSEGIFVGYRHYDTVGTAPLFPFGHGLSYTTFEYSDLTLSGDAIRAEQGLSVTLRVTNTGQRAGHEVIQLYVSDRTCTVPVAEKALKGFHKVYLAPGESISVTLDLTHRDLAWYDVDHQCFRAPSGTFEVHVGASSRDIRAVASFTVEGDAPAWPALHRNTLFGDLEALPTAQRILRDTLAPMAEASPLLAGMLGDTSDGESDDMMVAMMRYLPLRALPSFTAGAFSEDDITTLLERLRQAAVA